MLEEISWKDYCMFVLLTTAMYYIFVFLFLYKKQITLLKEGNESDHSTLEEQGSFSSVRADNYTPSSTPQTSLFEKDEINVSAKVYADNEDAMIKEEDNVLYEINLIPYAHELVNEIKQLIEKAKEKGYIKEELLFSMQKIIKAYQQLRGTSYEQDINNLIVTSCKIQCAIHLSADEVAKVWLN